MTEQIARPSRWLRPEDGPDVVYEFFAPFAHVEGRYEWCRIRSPTHGLFDTFILVGLDPVVVYVSSEAGLRFMEERYPECRAHLVPRGGLEICETEAGYTVEGRLRAGEGPVRAADMRFSAPVGATPHAVPYGGEGKPVWGSRRFTCWGVDLVVEATVTGRVAWASHGTERFEEARGILTLGSFGRIAPL